MSVLPCFSKLLEKIMYNRPYKYLSEHSCLFEKQFDFQVAHSADHAVIQIVSQILQAFNKNQHTIVILIDLSKQCDTLDHHILLQKLQFFGIENSNCKWFQSCSMPKGSILGLLLFFYVCKWSKKIDWAFSSCNVCWQCEFILF